MKKGQTIEQAREAEAKWAEQMKEREAESAANKAKKAGK